MYMDERTGREVRPGEGMKWVRRGIVAAALAGVYLKRDVLLEELPRRLKSLDVRSLVRNGMA